MKHYHHHLYRGKQPAWGYSFECLMSKRSRIQARKGVLAAPKHLHAITTTREIFSLKICKGGGGRKEIEWEERDGRRRRPSEMGAW
jgi:hypothetical protein